MFGMKTRTLNTHPYRQPLLFIIVALLLAVALAACGGDDATETEPTVAVEAPPAADEPTTEPAAEQPTEQPAEEPTAAPTDEPAPEPTEEAAAEEPAEDSATTSGALGLTGACGNAYYPIVEGRVLTYRSSFGGMEESNYTMSFSDVSPTDFTVSTGAGGADIISTTWHCTTEGMLSTTFNQLPGIVEGMEIEFVEAEGITFPTEEAFENGEGWTTRYTTNITMSDPDMGSMTMAQTVELIHTIVGEESVSVPAGDFPEAVRVDTAGTISMSIMLDDLSQPSTSFPMNMTSWYARGVGLVKQEVAGMLPEGPGGDSVIELVSVAD